MRWIAVLAVSAAGLAACGASAAPTQAKPMRIEFGLGGGNMVPFQVTIEPTENQCDWTATPSSPVPGSRATIE
jgi:hypothetical protein